MRFFLLHASATERSGHRGVWSINRERSPIINCWKSLMLLGMLNLLCAQFIPIVRIKPSNMRLGSVQRRKECDSARVGFVKGSDAWKLWKAEVP